MSLQHESGRGSDAPRSQPGKEATGVRLPAAPVLARLDRKLAERLPRWQSRGPEDPARVLLEVFAEALADLESDAAGLEERAYPRLLESLGEEPRWAAPARGAVVFLCDPESEEAVHVPRGTVVSARRVAGDAPLAFSTASEAWVSAEPLRRVVAVDGDGARGIVPYPLSGWDAGEVAVFGERCELSRYLYLGDPVLSLLRESTGSLVLEWPGHPGFLTGGRWEYSVEGGWRAVRVDLEEVRTTSGRPHLRMVIRGPFPGLREQRIEGGASPWLRLHLPGNRRFRTTQPRWIALRIDRDDEKSSPEFLTTPRADFVSAFPRPVARILSVAGERWDEHSLAPERFQVALASAQWDPALYFGWEKPRHGSLFLALARSGDGRQPLPDVRWEYSTARTFKSAEVSDGTASLTRSGSVLWRAPDGWAPQELFDERLYWMRVRWTDGTYPHPPRVQAVLPNAAAVCAGREVQNQVFEATLDSGGAASLELHSEEGDIAPFEEVLVKPDGADWLRPERSHVARQPDGRYLVRVGPGVSGSVRLKLPRVTLGWGARGNVPPGRIRVLEEPIEGIRAVDQPLPTSGGRDAESVASYRARIRTEWKTGERAVTQPDFARLVASCEPSVSDTVVKRDPDAPHRLYVTVLSAEPLSASALDRLERVLSDRVMLGTILEVCEPLRLPVEVVATVRQSQDPRPEVPPGILVELLETELQKEFDRQAAGDLPMDAWWRREHQDRFLRDAIERAIADDSGASRLGSASPLFRLSSWRFEVRLPQGQGDLETQAALCDASMVVVPQLDRVLFR